MLGIGECWQCIHAHVCVLSRLCAHTPPDPAPRSRTRPEARAIALHQTQGTIARLLQDGEDRPSLRRKRERSNCNITSHCNLLPPSLLIFPPASYISSPSPPPSLPLPILSSPTAPKPKNYSQQNYRRIKEIAARGRRRREEVDQPHRPATSSGKCAHTPAKVATLLQVQCVGPLTHAWWRGTHMLSAVARLRCRGCGSHYGHVTQRACC